MTTRAAPGPSDAPSPDRHAPRTPEQARDLAGKLARRLARQEVRVGVAVELLERAHAGAGTAVDQVALTGRRLAALAGVDIPGATPVGAVDAHALHPAVVEAEHIVRLRAAEIARRAQRRRRAPIRIESTVLGLASFVGFLVVGAQAALRAGALPGDALARGQSAQAVLWGRDPHLESVGFIWGPFPTLFEIPLIALRPWWPALTSAGLAAVVVSAAFMAGAVVQLLAWGRDAGAPRWFRIGAALLFVAHPLIWMYGSNGMSEAAAAFFLIVAARQLARWIDTDDLRPLALCGVAVGLAYLVRYEAVAAVLATMTVVGAVGFGRQSRMSPVRRRLQGAAVDLAIVGIPALAAVIGWALASWVTVGEALPQISSKYGNSALVRAASSGTAAVIGDMSAPGRAWFFLRQTGAAAPLVLVLVLAALWLGDRAAVRATAASAVVGGPLAVQLVLAVQGTTFPWFRYVSDAVVLAVMLVLVIGGAAPEGRSRWIRPVALLALVPGIVASTAVVRSGSLGAADDRRFLDGISAAIGDRPTPEAESMTARGARVARDIGRRSDVVAGAVLTDTSSTFAVVAAAPQPADYIIPSDRDFESVLSDPATFGVRYLLLRSPATPGDALIRRYPDLWTTNGAPVARLVQTWGGEGDRAGQFRLYAVDNPASHTRPAPESGFGTS